MIGDRLGPYEIIAPIGAGGMGEVYRAKDTRLGRDVALKILPPQMATDRDRLARFHREARAVAALNHPNVVTLYSVEESDGVHFLTMELVDGEPLSAVIPPEGWPVDRAVDVAVAVADAIADAHDKGIVHRDLKPANVMITRESSHLAATYDLDWDAADRHFAFPMAQQVGHPITRPMYGGLEFLRGNIERAIALAERAIEEDPLEVWPRMNLHAYLQGAGRDKEAYAQATRVLELDPNLVVAHVSIAHFHADWGQLPEAVAAARQARAVGPWYLDATATLAALLRVSGEGDQARALYQMVGSGKDFGESRAQAVYYLLCGEVNTGADWTEKAIAERDGSMMYYLRFVVSKGLRASGRWPAIARMLNLRISE